MWHDAATPRSLGFISFHAPETVATCGRDDLPAGRSLASLFERGVVTAGVPVLEPLHQHESYGWAFSVAGGDAGAIWCMLQRSDGWLLTTVARTPVWRRMFRGGSSPNDLHRTLDATLVAVARSIDDVHDVRWHATAEDLKERRHGEPR